jgi:hypothetical protein
MQGKKLFYNQEQKEDYGAPGEKEILSPVPQPYASPGDEIGPLV